MKWSSDGSELLLASVKGELIRFDPHSGVVTHRTHVHSGGYITDVAYLPDIAGYALLIVYLTGAKRVLMLDPVSGSQSGTYSTSLLDCFDPSISPNGNDQLIRANGKPPQIKIRERGLQQTHESSVELETVTYCIAKFEPPGRTHHPDIEHSFVNSKSWNGYRDTGNEETYFDSSGQLVTNDLVFVFTEKEWWHSDLADKAVFNAPKGDLFTAHLDLVDWTTKTVTPDSLHRVIRPKVWDWVFDNYPNLAWSTRGEGRSSFHWSPNGEYIVVTYNHFIGLWSALDGRFVRPIGCHSVLRKDSRVSTHEKDILTGNLMVAPAVHWSPDGKLIASVLHRWIFVWEVETGRLIDEFYNSEANFHPLGVYRDDSQQYSGAICWSPDSRSLASVSLFGDVEIYNV